MRLDKFLVEMSIGSRSQVKELIKQKRISVNQKTVTSAKAQINENKDIISLDGNQLVYEKFTYFMLNKPKGVISATEDKEHKTVIDLLSNEDYKNGIFPVGRLDKDTRGLLILTNDGALAHNMLSPKKHVEKEYIAEVKGIMTEADKNSFEQGIVLKDFTCLPARLEIIAINQEKETSRVKITLKEGKFHQVKRMVLACGKEVSDLKRIKMGNLLLDKTLKEGSYRRLTSEELELLKKS
ncbi:pseudouridine synthase [Streptococcus urinalis FB127-CNA-2]|uniref:Pseudouridine synthase n=1 Tax=Streptococcus urinalis 2285-97 TaxID=764291 RepID=G5KHF0_9STRE|nr:pseudouridine synthase [Streptococcus urinalis]EHJ55915.1 pseudouridylate synthase [Streptococcus urinalis 2285-97]EKS22508.1 pseudouridine synthase [Streptococcus urinalis FB127-CNA-2]VEF32321.1 ribosomal small subunit pseudouridine synthase B [Streptococcus urinalis]